MNKSFFRWVCLVLLATLLVGPVAFAKVPWPSWDLFDYIWEIGPDALALEEHFHNKSTVNLRPIKSHIHYSAATLYTPQLLAASFAKFAHGQLLFDDNRGAVLRDLGDVWPWWESLWEDNISFLIEIWAADLDALLDFVDVPDDQIRLVAEVDEGTLDATQLRPQISWWEEPTALDAIGGIGATLLVQFPSDSPELFDYFRIHRLRLQWGEAEANFYLESPPSSG